MSVVDRLKGDRPERMGSPQDIQIQKISSNMAKEALLATFAAIDVTPNWPKARDARACLLYQLRSAQNLGIFHPLTTEQAALSQYLNTRQAGRELCDYAWRSFVYAPKAITSQAS